MSIQIRDLHKVFGSKLVLNGVDLDVSDGDTLALLGASGAGKSVVLKHIVGLLTPERGSVTVDGRIVESLSQDELYGLRRQAGYVFQFAALFDSMTLAENVGMGLRRVPGMKEAEIRDRVDECLALVDLAGLENRYPSEISGGQRKRAGIARAIATRPKYLLYDEPTTGLDPITTTVIRRLILRMREELGVTGVVVTHDMESAYVVADHLALLHEGLIHFVGTPDEVRTTEDPVVRGFIEGRPELLEAVS